jgi:hypothetical protein
MGKNCDTENGNAETRKRKTGSGKENRIRSKHLTFNETRSLELRAASSAAEKVEG